jgi:hypothetical protein
MGVTARFHETLRRLAMIDEGSVEDQAGLGLGRVVAAPEVATAPGYDIEAALEDPTIADGCSAGHVSLPAAQRKSIPEAEDEQP